MVSAQKKVGRWSNEVLQNGAKWCTVGAMVGMYLSGEFDHTLDPKGRVTLPARYREYFQDGVMLVRLPNGDPCISVFHPDSWAEFDQKYLEARDFFENEADRWSTRDIYKNQDYMEPDKAGRVLLPAKRIAELGLSGKVKIIGVRSHLEIWDPDTLAAAEQGRRGQHG
jgi:MraZ protein